MFSPTDDFKIFPLGDNAATVSFGNRIAPELNEKAVQLSQMIAAQNFQGLVEIVAAYSSLTIFYDVAIVRRANPDLETAFAAVRFLTETCLLEIQQVKQNQSRSVTVPICFDREFAIDLKFIATANKLSIEKVKTIFLGQTYNVFMLGFLPGFAYMGEVDEQIATARKNVPRAKTPAGSVGIAGRQTGIYPLDSPGGWQIIGRTPLRLFDANRNPPTFFQTGDAVQFIEIARREFDLIIESGNR